MFSEFTQVKKMRRLSEDARQAASEGSNGKSLYKQIAVYRRYYDGRQELYMTPRQKEYLQMHGTAISVAFNHCATVVDALIERLMVQGFIVTKKQSKPQTKKDPDEKIAALLWDWWDASRLDEIQSETHRAASRDGEAFVMTSWNKEEERPEFIFHPRYTEQKPGDGYGVWMVYENDEQTGKALYAVKQWQEQMGDKFFSRRTLYYPDRIEKYRYEGNKWERVTDAGDESWPIPYVLADGTPIGIPFAHFKNPSLRSDLADIISIQDALNKVWLDILAAADSSGFRTIVTIGFRPTTDGAEPKVDGSNLLRFSPGQMMSTSKPSNIANVHEIDPGDLTQLLSLEERLVLKIASISHIPLGRFQSAKQVAASETLKQQEAPLISKVKERRNKYGNAWEDVMQVALNLWELYKGEANRGVEISTQWSPDDVRNDAASLDVAEKKKGLGISMEIILTELGYTPEQIESIKESPEYQARLANLMAITATVNETPSKNFGLGTGSVGPNQQMMKKPEMMNGNGKSKPAS